MNKKIKLITVLSAAALVTGLVSCGEVVNSSSAEASSSSETPVSSSVAKVAIRIQHDAIDYVVVNEEVDLDTYITIKYDDNSTDKNYNVTCTSENVSIEGHKVKAAAHGEYVLTISAGTVKARITLSVVSEEHKELIDFLAPLSETPGNYTLTQWDINDNNRLEYGQTYVHNENYIAIYDENDPGAVYGSDTAYAGEPTSTLLAKLSDGHAYWGSFEGTKDDYKPVFEPGYANWSGYYITGDLNLDATDVSYETTEAGEEYILMGNSFEETLLNYGMSTFPDNYGYSYAGAEYGGLYDTDGDDEGDMALFTCYVSNGTQTGYWTIVGIQDIGTSSIDIMETAIESDSYLPTKIQAPEISTAFSALATGKNYTVTTELTSVDSSGNALKLDDYSSDALANITGCTHVTITTTFTENGVISTYTGLPVEENEETGKYLPAEEEELLGTIAFWDDGTNTYLSSLNNDGKMSAKEVGAENKTVYESGLISAMTADNVTLEDANGTIWASKKTSGTTVTYAGQCGDNDETDVTNSLFGKIFDMNGYGFSIIAQGAGLGTNLVTPVEFTGGDKHALTLYSNYEYFTVNTATNEISVDALVYLPIGLQDYIDMKFSVSNVGTTTNDFNFDFATETSSSSSAE